MNPTPVEALNSINAILAEYKGTRKDHETINLWVHILSEAIKPKPEVPSPSI